MPWTSTKGFSWQEKYGAIEAYCEHYMRELDRILEHSKNPKKDFPSDWAQREAVNHILSRIREVADEEAGTEFERLDRQVQHMFKGITKMGDRLVQVENLFRDLAYTIQKTIDGKK